jgi:hypothetical protein
MKYFQTGSAVLFVLMFLLTSCGSYKYMYDAKSKSVVSKGNPKGITLVSIFPYDNDPDIHGHGAGYYEKSTTKKMKQFCVDPINVTEFRCYPCFGFVPEQKYVFMFKGKPGQYDVAVKLVKDKDGVVREIK